MASCNGRVTPVATTSTAAGDCARTEIVAVPPATTISAIAVQARQKCFTPGLIVQSSAVAFCVVGPPGVLMSNSRYFTGFIPLLAWLCQTPAASMYDWPSV
jgi:hypothetical protein